MLNKLFLTCQVGEVKYESAEYGDAKMIVFYANFTLLPDSKIETFTITAFGKMYDFFKQNIKKDDLILISGRIKSSERKGKNGMFRTTDIIANEIYPFTQLPKSERIDDIETFAEQVSLPFD